MGPTCDPPMDWQRLLDPANGGPGESPGYRETMEAIAANPKQPRSKKGARSKPSTFPSLKHAAQD
jgi:hypothetical protein